MAKIRSVEELEDAISDEVSWRKVELTTARKLVQQSTGSVQVANLRSGVLLLYAHWEGWVKGISQLYIRYVNSQKLPFSRLSNAFLGNALKVKFGSIENASAAEVHNEFATFLKQSMATRATVSEDLVQTQSNLSSKVFSDILVRLGLPRRPLYMTRAELIDEKLVNRRNSIAHGRFLELKDQDYLELHNQIIELLELFTDDVRNAASTSSFMSHLE